ncbi:MAG: fibrobacter succinogenes major paralogous domain-containing protein [Chitinispirillales bacterium]|jgi:uncharacterized protein (TIGR02145 family)|nr:fibrobacter succinogenes major paralogous domain-containing protein [Chitinispirillales bacterium]
MMASQSSVLKAMVVVTIVAVSAFGQTWKDIAGVANKTATVTDKRDGQKYRAVTIGGKTWMAEDLNYKTGNSWCYNDSDSYCKKYGRLYDWETAKTACLAGWHLPTVQEWDNLSEAVGGVRKSVKIGSEDVFYWDGAGKKLKSTSGWYDNGNGTDNYGFTALPGGGRSSGGRFLNAGNNGHWWTATENGSGNAYLRDMRYNSDNVYEYYFVAGIGFSVRCVRD